MNNADAKTAVSNIKQQSEAMKLNGISAQAVKNELFFHELNHKP